MSSRISHLSFLERERERQDKDEERCKGAKTLTETSPLAKLLSVGNLDQRDLVLAAEGNNELLVGLLLAGLVEHAHVGLTAVEGLGGLTQTARKSVVDQRDLEDALERVKDRHAARGGRLVGSDLDFFGRGDRGRGLFYIRLQCPLLACVLLFASHHVRPLIYEGWVMVYSWLYLQLLLRQLHM